MTPQALDDVTKVIVMVKTEAEILGMIANDADAQLVGNEIHLWELKHGQRFNYPSPAKGSGAKLHHLNPAFGGVWVESKG